MLSGSIAMGIYIMPRATTGIDFVVHLQADDIEGLVKHFEGSYYCNKTAVRDAMRSHSLFNVIDHASGFKADFVVLKNEEYRLTEFERRRQVNYYDINLYIVSVEDLLISKLIWIQDWQAAVQMEDIKNIFSLPDLKKDYLYYWVEKLNLNTFGLLGNE